MKMPVAKAMATSRPGFAKCLPWLVVVATLLFVGCIRVRLMETPLERDEGEYAYAGQLILQGIPPYELVYNMKLPGTYYAYAAGMAIFGQTVSGVHLTLLTVNSLTCVFVFLLGRRISGVTAGLAACASFAIMSVSPVVLGLAAHATQFVALFAAAGAWLLWRALTGGERRMFFLAGLLSGLAFLMKQPGICFGLFAATMILWQARQDRHSLNRELAWRLSGFGAGMFLPFGFLCLTTFLAGDFRRFWFWTFDYASRYAGERTLAHGCGSLANHILDQLPVYGALWLLAAAGLLAAVRLPASRKELAFALVFFGFSCLGTACGLYFRGHYFVLMLPAFALLLGLGLEALRTFLASRSLPWAAPVLLLLALGWSILQQRGVFFQMPPGQLGRMLYEGNPVLESQTIAQYIREHSQPEARVAVVGSEPQLYFYARRHSATGYIYTYPLMEAQPYARAMQREMIGEIESAKPEFIVLVSYKFSWLKKPTSDLTIIREMEQYARQFYLPVAAVGRRPEDQSALAGGRNTNSPPESMILYQRKPDAS